MSRYGIELYASLEAGDRARHRLEAMRQPQRRARRRSGCKLMRRQMARAKSFGIEFEFISPAEAGAHRADPAHRRPGRRRVDSRRRQGQPHRPHAVARQGRAHARRARSSKACRSTGVDVAQRPRRRRALDARRRRRRRSPARRSSTAAASGRASSAALAGVNVPLYSAEHFYIVTEPIAGVTPDLPVIRDPDGFIYYKEEVGGLVMGGFEPVAKPWNVVADSRRLRVPAAARGLGPVRDPDAQRDPPHAVPRDRARSRCC